MNIVLWILTFILILVALFLILVILMQKDKSAGMGAALGGGMAESTFGAETSNVLSKATINSAIALFVLGFALYLARMYQHTHASSSGGGALPVISGPALPPAPADSAPLPVTPPPAHNPAPPAGAGAQKP